MNNVGRLCTTYSDPIQEGGDFMDKEMVTLPKAMWEELIALVHDASYESDIASHWSDFDEAARGELAFIADKLWKAEGLIKSVYIIYMI